jgi:hypothetical protein
MNAIIPHRYASFVFSTLMALSMSVPMSAVMLIVNGGLALGWELFLLAWARAAATGFAVALPIASFVSPRIGGLTDRLTKSERK